MKLRNWFWPAFFLILGVISVLGQAVILREITTLFYGSEMFYGLGLGTWLLFTGLGSLLATKLKFLKKKQSLLLRNKQKILWVVLGGWFVFLPFLVVFLRFLVARVILVGEVPSFWFSFFVLDSILFIFCFPLGALFALGTTKWPVNRAYFWETIGFAFGGLFFSFVLATTSFSSGLKWRYPGLVKAINSRYQQIIVTKKDSQLNYFTGGQLTFTNQESYDLKQTLNLVAPLVDEPKKILVVGNPNIASEIKKLFFPEKIVFLEIDEKLVNLEKELLAPGIDLVFEDPRRFLNRQEEWDLIIFSLGNPQTLLANRYFTKECFTQVKNRLSQNKAFVLLTYLPTDYQSEEASRFGGSIYQTLKAIFPNLELLTPEDQLLFLASKSEIKINEKKINPKFADYFWYQIQNLKRKEIRQKFEVAPTKINTDVEPTTFFYQQLFWQTIFSFKMPVYLIKVIKIVPVILLIIFTVMLFAASKQTRLGAAAAGSSFILMSLETLIIFIFQTQIGHLYSQISLIFATVLVGMGVGVMITERLKIKNFKVVFLAYLPILILIHQVKCWPIIALWIGIIGGLIFALINQMYFQRAKNTGFIYAFDLFGGFLGAFLTSSFLLPVFGLEGVLKGLTGVILINLLFTSKHQE